MNQWDGIRHFRPDSKIDNWGDPSKMKRSILVKADRLRDFIGKPLYAVSAYRPSTTSEHGKGLAIDLICPDMHPFDLYMVAERFGFNGLGVYRDWQFRGKKTGGIHADTGVRVGRWACYKDGNHKQRYIAADLKNLRKYKII